MIYAALTFWLLVIALTAWGVHRLWSAMIQPKILNTALLPGTLVAQVGHVLGLLVTGATISNTTLYKNDDSGDPETTRNPDPKIPVVGHVIIGLLPLVACAMGIFLVARWLGGPVLVNLTSHSVGPVLPTTIAGVWQLLRDQITLVESIVVAFRAADFADWSTWLFLYLLICLTVRTAPFPGNLRGALGAIIVLGIGAATLCSLFELKNPYIQDAWAVLNLTVATLLFLLLVSLLIRGSVGLVQILRQDA